MSIGLKNIELESLCKKILSKTFLGVFPCDYKLKIKCEKNFQVIFNLSKHDETGSHFVAINKTKNHIEYFDPFGLKCMNKYIKKFLKSFKIKLIENRFKIQDDSSIFCGLFCMCFLLCRKNRKSIQTFVKYFSPNNYKINDGVVTNVIINEIMR